MRAFIGKRESERERTKRSVAVMLRAGVPAKFKKHSTRHAAGSAAAATPQGREDFLRTAQMSGPVFDKYYKCPIENRHDYSAPLQVPSLSLDD